ncbi:hypothetical protein KTR9_1338 [Gordonia sp. KTR9]|nr:hypothetical protein KTR9_1338 [Gordonia sp. KTR9]
MYAQSAHSSKSRCPVQCTGGLLDRLVEETVGDVKTPALWSLIQAHLDEYGVTDAEFARRMGVSPQTLNSWKKRGVRQLPSRDKLESVAELTRNTYAHVLDAALVDAGYRNELRAEVVEVAQRIRDLGAEYWDALDDLIEELRQEHYARIAAQRPKLSELIGDGTPPTTATRPTGEAKSREKNRGGGSLPDKIRDAGKRVTNTRLGLAAESDQSSDNTLPASYDTDPLSADSTSNVSEEVEDLSVAARRGRGKTKGEQLRDRDAQLGEESQVAPDEEN